MQLAVRFIQITIIFIPIFLFGWLGVKNFVPNGIFVVKHPVSDVSSFVDTLSPRERVSEVKKNEEGDWVQTIFGDPVFFFVHPHRSFDSVEATVTFKNTHTPIVEFGALSALNPERYVLKPLQNLILDQSHWSRLSDGETLLLQREAKYKSVEDFLARPPSRFEVATYHADFSVPFRLPNYSASKVLQTIPVSLRGSEAIKTYLKNEPLHVRFLYTDMNRDHGSDAITISVTDESGRSILYFQTEDDGNATSNKKASAQKMITVDTQALPEGVYKIELHTSRDIFVRVIETTQQKIVFLNGVYLADEDGFRPSFSPVTFWTEAKRLSMQTRHAQSVQTVKVGSGTLDIPAPYTFTTTTVKDAGLIPVVVSKGDLEVITDAPIAFAPSQYFRPDPVRLLAHTDLDALKINYIFAKYTPPIVRDGWSVATVQLDAKNLLFDNGSWKFTFSTPEIAEFKSSVDVKSIDLVMKRSPIDWDRFAFP